MSTTLTTFSTDELSLRWREQFISKAVNEGTNAGSRVGVLRGFRLIPGAGALTVTCEADDTWGDHTAVARVAGSFGINVQRVGGNFSLDLSAYAGQTVVLALNVAYTTSNTTVGKITAYELSPTDELTPAPERPYLVVLGTVLVPASGIIPQANINNYLRNEAWDEASPAEIIPKQVIRNSSFELSDTAQTQHCALYWSRDSASAANVSYWYISSANPAAGLKHLQLDYVAGTGPVVSSMFQTIGMPINSGELLRLSLKVKALKVATGGSLNVRFHYLDETGAVPSSSPVTFNVPLTAIDSTYRTLSPVITSPVGGAGGANTLSHIEIQNNLLTAGSDGNLVRIDDVELWLDKRSARRQMTADAIQEVIGSAFSLLPDHSLGSTVDFASSIAKSLLMKVDPSGSEAIVTAQRRDASITNPPFLDWLGRARFGTAISTLRASQGAGVGPTTGEVTPFLQTPYDDLIHGITPVTCVWETYATQGGGVKVRIYMYYNGEIWVTTNAAAQNAVTNDTPATGPLTWAKDVAGIPAWKWVLGSTSDSAWPRLENRPSSQDTNWIDSGLGAGWIQFWRAYPSVGPTSYFTANFSVSTSLGFYPVDTTGAAVSAQLPDPSFNAGRTLVFKDVKGNFGTNALTLVRNGAEKFEGLQSPYICNANFQEVRVYSDGLDWWLV